MWGKKWHLYADLITLSLFLSNSFIKNTLIIVNSYTDSPKAYKEFFNRFSLICVWKEKVKGNSRQNMMESRKEEKKEKEKTKTERKKGMKTSIFG